MSQTTKNITRHELIGLSVEVAEAKNKSLIGLNGKIVDETKNTLIIEVGNKTKTLLKGNIALKIKLEGKTIQVDGRLLVGRPEERIKKTRKIQW